VGGDVFGVGVYVASAAVEVEVGVAKGVDVYAVLGVGVEANMWKTSGLGVMESFLLSLDAAVISFGSLLPFVDWLVATLDYHFLSPEPFSRTKFGSSVLFARSERRYLSVCCPPLPDLLERQSAS
jgi:hypothetical protein